MSAAWTGVNAVAASNAPVTAPAKNFILMTFPHCLPAFHLPAWLHLLAAAGANLKRAEPAGSYRLNTYTMDAVELFFSSGAPCMTNGDCFEPARTAMYCLPLTA